TVNLITVEKVKIMIKQSHKGNTSLLPGAELGALDSLVKGTQFIFCFFQVKAIVAEQLGVKQEQVTNDASFVDDLGADSLDTVELVMALEEEFETEIPDEDAEKITTVQQAIDYINDRRAQA